MVLCEAICMRLFCVAFLELECHCRGDTDNEVLDTHFMSWLLIGEKVS